MQVNLTNKPVVLRREGIVKAIREASKRTSAQLDSPLAHDMPDDASEALILAELDRVFALLEAGGSTQAAAAALLTELAIGGYLMLPATGLSVLAIAPTDHEMALSPFLTKIDSWVQRQAPRWFLKRGHLQLLFATSCRQEGEFDLHVFAHFHSWLVHEQLVESKFSLSSPVYLLLRAIEEADGSTLRRDLRHAYLIWRASEADRQIGFDAFLADPKHMAGMRVHGHERERIELPKQVARRHARANERKAKARTERTNNPFIEGLHQIARNDSATAPEDYFSELRGSSNVKGFRPDAWIEEPVDYPGREAVAISKVGAKWFIAFRAFLTHRRKDYESEKEVRSALHVLADYLLLYLPWWMERNPDTSLEFPSSPRQFLRYFYVDRTRFHDEETESLGALPKTFNELLHLRRPTPASRNSTRLAIQKFFNFVLTYFEDNPEFVSKGMKNPIRTDFDNEVARRRTKTDKVPFAEDVFPFLIHYGQALEGFGEFLQQEAYIRNRFRELPNGPLDGYDTADWGYVPVFWYRAKLYRLDWVPNIFLVSKRTLNSNPEGLAGIYVQGQRVNAGASRNVTLNLPHLTVVRLLNALVETGLRAQSLQWLDRRTFDQLAPPLLSLAPLYGHPEKQSYHPLYINTDKTHEEWKNLVSWRVRRSLVAEGHFQASLVDEFCATEVAYEDRSHSRFLPVMALFRSNRGAKPVSDSLYSYRWVEFLFGFQEFYNSKDGANHSQSDDALVLLKEREQYDDDASIADIYLAIHTPHACRATYATLKDGDLEVSEIAEQLGHTSTVVTNTYQVPQMKRLLEKLKAIDERTIGTQAFDVSGDGPEFLHPDRPGSAVRSAFERSREQAISDFGFVPGVALWSLDELNGDSSTLELLRQSPASVIRWHPTHVCPVGNQCPKEVVANAGGMSRCGLCPLAAKCIDHLPAIEAKQRELHERIRTTTIRQEQMEKRGASQSEIDALHRDKQTDTKELLGWKLSSEILRTRQRELGSDDRGYHVDQPELVRKQLELVTRNRPESEFFLQRIADSNAFPSLESSEVRARALRYTRLMLAKQDRLTEAAFLDVPQHSETTVFASLVKPYIEAKGLSLEQLGTVLDDVSRAATLTAATATPLLGGC